MAEKRKGKPNGTKGHGQSYRKYKPQMKPAGKAPGS